jgi:peroxiredoxin
MSGGARALLASLGVALALAAAGCSRTESAGPEGAGAAAEVKAAPSFTLPDLDGNPVSLAALRGKTVVIDFWATWCPPCEFQIPVLNKIHEKHGANGVVVLGVSVDVEGKEVVAPYAAQHQVRYTILLGSEEVARDFGAPGFPALVVVGPDGTIRSTHVGLIEEEELERVLAEAQADRAT